MKVGDIVKSNQPNQYLPGLGVVTSIDAGVIEVHPEGSTEHFLFTEQSLIIYSKKVETKVTTASVRIMLSHSYCNFEVSMELNNENGIQSNEIELARIDCQKLAQDAVNEYKKAPNANPKEELKRVEKKIEEIKSSISEKVNGKEITDPKEIEQIEKLPLYKGNPKTDDGDFQDKGGAAKVKKGKTTQMKIPNDIMGLSADD